MTDNEIIKALECIASDKDVLCKGCSYNKYYLNRCHKENAKDALDLINRQKAEIERLEDVNIRLTKAEAIKEFAERLKEKAYRPNPYPYIEILTKEDIDNHVKEMVGDKQ